MLPANMAYSLFMLGGAIAVAITFGNICLGKLVTAK